MSEVEGLLDASFIVRYLTGDPPELARRARGRIESDRLIGMCSAAILESAYVLTEVYRVPRQAVVDALVTLIQRKNLEVVDADVEFVILGLLMCRPSTRVSFGDAMIWAAARSYRVPSVYTFDTRFPAEGLTLQS